jgi:G:T-mismatch repair DNA endonuclease (very short patch repair protein)
MRIVRTGSVASLETRLKIRQARLGKLTPPEVRAKQSASMREAHASGRHPGPSRKALTRFESKIENAFAELLDALGVRYERQYFAHVPGAGRHPWDFAIPDRRILIEVDGCYWHGCKTCGFEGVDGRAALDEKQTRAAEEVGWKVIRIAEHDIGLGKAGIFDAVE